jgi:hypothetical protein
MSFFDYDVCDISIDYSSIMFTSEKVEIPFYSLELLYLND